MHYYRHPAKLASLLIGGALGFSSSALAAGFALHEQNASLLGGFYAGSAAIAEDASTNWYNPAGLTNLEGMNVVISGVNVSSQSKFKGTTTLDTVGFGNTTETGSAEGGTARLVPAFHTSYKINDQWAAGFSIVTPFGLSTDYSPESLVRYNATESELKTITLTPAVAYKPVEWFSVGVGFDAQYAEVKLDGVLGVGGFPAFDSQSKNDGNDWGFGWHAGVLAIVPQTGTHLGLTFHSNIEQKLEGTSKLRGPLNPTGAKSSVSGKVDLPWSIVGSVSHDLNDYFTVLANAEYVHWSSIETLQLDGVQTGDGTTTSSIDPLNYENTWGFAAAVRAHLSEHMMVTLGGGYEQTPTNDTDRDIRLPDANRWIASAGIRYIPHAADKVQLDVGYSHIWGKKVDVNKTLGSDTDSQTVTAVGHNTAQANLLGAQITIQI